MAGRFAPGARRTWSGADGSDSAREDAPVDASAGRPEHQELQVGQVALGRGADSLRCHRGIRILRGVAPSAPDEFELGQPCNLGVVGLRRRGFTPESLQLFAERIGVTKSDSWIDYSTLEACLREDLETKAYRAMAVLNPVKLVLTNWDDVMGEGHIEPCEQAALPHKSDAADNSTVPMRHFTIGKEVWIEREDFEEVPPKGYKRLFPGNKVRLKGGYVIECTEIGRAHV